MSVSSKKLILGENLKRLLTPGSKPKASRYEYKPA